MIKSDPKLAAAVLPYGGKSGMTVVNTQSATPETLLQQH
jgi:carboxyl-terminal processing protease